MAETPAALSPEEKITALEGMMGALQQQVDALGASPSIRPDLPTEEAPPTEVAPLRAPAPEMELRILTLEGAIETLQQQTDIPGEVPAIRPDLPFTAEPQVEPFDGRRKMPELGIPPKGVPPTDPINYPDLIARGKLNPLGFFNVRAFGATGDPNIDASKAIQRAADAAGKAGGGTLYFPQGVHLIGTTVQMPTAAISLVGAGLSSIIKGDADPLILSSIDPVNSKLVVRDLKIELTKTSAQKGLNVTQTWTADPKASLMIDNVWFLCNGHDDSVQLYIKGVREASISNCWFETTAGKSTGIELIDRAMNISINSCQFITLTRGIYMHRTSGSVTVEGIRVADCLFVGGYDAIEADHVLSLQVTGCMIDSVGGTPLILASPNWHTIVGNWLATSGSGKHVIDVTGPALPCRIVGNYFGAASGDGIRVEASSGAVRQFSIIGNTFGSNLTIAINFGLSGGVIDRMKVVGNDFNGPDIGVHLGTSTPRGNNVVTDNTFLSMGTAAIAGGDGTNIVRNNVGWVTENGGLGVIASGDTAVTVTHGLSKTPAAQDISLTIGGFPTNDIGFLSVSAITATQFTINCQDDPGVATCRVYWQATATRS